MAGGEHRGGLYMALKGEGKGLEWHIIAEGDDGPFIPSMACAAVITKWAHTQIPPAAGARPAHEAVSLSE